MNGVPRFRSWRESQYYVIQQITELSGKVDTLLTDVTILKVKAAILGVVGGVAVNIIITIVTAFLKN